ncbi:MAG: hypothetical protein IPH45_17875 [Bacteroidales bacterium]|nr:hypothetical protein [Bacteroidales bacterium]
MQRHLAAFPNGNHKAEVKKMIEPLLYKAAVEADWYTEYETYIKICPDGSNIEKVTQRLEFLRTHTAKIKVDYPANEKGGDSPYSNVSSPYFEINTTFSETGGEVGYKLHGSVGSTIKMATNGDIVVTQLIVGQLLLNQVKRKLRSTGVQV